MMSRKQAIDRIYAEKLLLPAIFDKAYPGEIDLSVETEGETNDYI